MSFDVNHFETSNNSEIVPLFDEFTVFFFDFFFRIRFAKHMRVLWPVGFDDLTYDECLSQHLKIEHTHTYSLMYNTQLRSNFGYNFQNVSYLFVACVNDSELKTERKKNKSHTQQNSRENNNIHQTVVISDHIWNTICLSFAFHLTMNLRRPFTCKLSTKH